MSERVEPLEAGPSDVWERVRQFVHSTRKTIQVVVAYNADAAAASVTLMALFKESLISFSVHPVSGYDELTQVVEQTNLAQDFAVSGDGRREDELFVLVGLGAPVDLRQYFDFSRHIVVVLDSYRPIHLSTLRIEDGVRCILWNRQLIRAEVNSFFRAERAADLLRQRRQRRKREEKRHTQRTRTEVTGAEGQGPENNWDDSDSEDSLDLSTSSEDDVDEEQEEPLSQSQVEVNWMAEPDDEDEGGLPSYLEKLYYSAECAGRSCAVEVYDLAVLLNRMKPPMLWHAAIGVTDLFSRRLIDYGKYLVEMRPLHDAVTLQRSMARRGILEEVTEESLNAPEKRFHSSTMQLQNMDEPQLLLLRHTNLWSAIWHHPVTASALGLHHTEEGQGFLSQLLASRCGVSLKMAHQPWREVPRETQKEALRFVQAELQHVLESKASYLSYPNTIRCVGRSVGYSAEVSTFDACILFEACMAAVPPTSIYSVESTMSPDQAELLVADRLRNFYRTQFWRAHAVLDVDPNDKVFSEALQEAVLLHRAVTDATGALMQPGILQSTRGIHYVQPSDPTRTTGALESFSSVYRLGALTTRLLYSLTTERGGGRFSREVRPLLLTCALPSPKPQASASSSESHSGLIQSNNTFTDGSSPATAQGPSTGAVVTSAAVDVTAWSRQKVHFAALISHEGVTQGRMAPIPHMGCFNSCVEDDEEFVTLPARQWTQRNVVVVDSRESASHLTELLHLRSLERWDPRRDRPSWTS